MEENDSRLVKGIGGVSQEGRPLITRVIKGSQIITLNTRTTSQELFDPPDEGGVDMLPRVQHCVELKIDLNQALSQLEHG